jgi:hypothetical protein
MRDQLNNSSEKIKEKKAPGNFQLIRQLLLLFISIISKSLEVVIKEDLPPELLKSRYLQLISQRNQKMKALEIVANHSRWNIARVSRREAQCRRVLKI